MSMPHATGTLTPHKPIPTNTRFVIASNMSWKSAKEIAKPKNQAIDVLRFKTIELILSVTEANVSPGSITGVVECIGPSVYGLFGSSAIFKNVRQALACRHGFRPVLKHLNSPLPQSAPS